jgi:hypothetical protein
VKANFLITGAMPFPVLIRASGGRMAQLGSPVNVAPVPDIKQENPALANIEFVEHPIVAHPQTTFPASGQPVVGIGLQALPHLIHAFLNGRLDGARQAIIVPAKGLGPHLQRGRHGSLGLPETILACLDFLAGLIQFGLDLVFQLQAVLTVVLKPGPEILQFLAGELRDGRFQFLYRTHITDNSTIEAQEKPKKFCGATCLGKESTA